MSRHATSNGNQVDNVIGATLSGVLNRDWIESCRRAVQAKALEEPMQDDGVGDFNDLVDELYQLDPREFTARRNALARHARGSGNSVVAERIARMRRPTQSAWLLNQWARAQPDAVDALGALGAALRDAQRRGSADSIRELSDRRRESVAAATSEVEAVAAELGVTPSPAGLRDIVSTLRAAIADEAVTTDLRRGRLSVGAQYTGLGPAGLSVVPPAGSSATASLPESGASIPAHEHQTRVAQAQSAMSAAVAAVRTARRDAAAADQVAAELGVAVAELETEATRLRGDLARVENELAFTRRRASAADDESASAAVELADAQNVAAQARAHLAGLVDDAGPRSG